jgi:hypothetical protein
MSARPLSQRQDETSKTIAVIDAAQSLPQMRLDI